MQLQQALNLMYSLGALTVYVKPLAENDNSKQQIYMGGDFTALNIFHFGEVQNFPSLKVPNMKARIDLYWVDLTTGNTCQAPGAQLILYPRYPEVRLSGFLNGCPLAPSQYMQPVPRHDRQTNNAHDGRMLFLGTCHDGRVLAFLAPAGSELALQSAAILPSVEKTGVFYRIGIAPIQADSRNRLIARLEEIHRQGWHESRRLDKQGNVIPYAARNGGGYTLEALLGIIPNSRSEPDFDGWEVKAHSGNILTLMTPEPDGGFYGEHGAKAFLHKYADPKRDDPHTLYFTGTHRVNTVHQKTGMTLLLRGYDAKKQAFDPAGGLELVDDQGELAAAWSYAALMVKWNRKHRQAVYVPYKSIQLNGVNGFNYKDPLHLGEGTDFSRFLDACATGLLYYDPATRLSGTDTLKPELKARSQFRISMKNMASLYEMFNRHFF